MSGAHPLRYGDRVCVACFCRTAIVLVEPGSYTIATADQDYEEICVPCRDRRDPAKAAAIAEAESLFQWRDRRDD